MLMFVCRESHGVDGGSTPCFLFFLFILLAFTAGCTSSTAPAGDSGTPMDASGQDADDSMHESSDGPGDDMDATVDEEDPSMPHEAGMGADVTSSESGKDGGSGPGDGSTGSEPQECNDASACDDGISCTIDECIEGVCSHSIDADACNAGQACDPRAGGCVDTTICGDDADCEDDDPCTRNETCNLSASRCEWDILDNDGDGHAAEVCGGDDFDDGAAASHPGRTEICDGLDNDGNGAIDDGSGVTSNCGDSNGSPVQCLEGECALDCEDGRADCDGRYDTGCEVQTDTSIYHCGMCDYGCPSCVDGACMPGACDGNPNNWPNLIDPPEMPGDVPTWVNECISTCGESAHDCVGECVGEEMRPPNLHESYPVFVEGCQDCVDQLAACKIACAEEAGSSLQACDCEPKCIDAFEQCAGAAIAQCHE